MNILELYNIRKKYPEFELRDISFQIPSGTIMGMIGENGAGKTTLISIILQQIGYDQGTVLFEGNDIRTNIQQVKQNIGFVLDECDFPVCFNAGEISDIMKHIYVRWDHPLFIKYLGFLNVDPKKEIRNMSKGTKNKLLLATALAHMPKLLIMDEVTSGLDPVVRFEVLTILKEYVEKYHTAILFSTHVTSDLDKIADNFVLIHKGKLRLKSSLQDLDKNYRIVRCNKEEISRFPNKIAEIEERDYIQLLLKINSDMEITERMVKPDLETLMLMFIKGEKNEGVD